MARKRRSFFWLFLIILAASLLGGVFGSRAEVAAATSNGDDMERSLKSFTTVYDLVEQNFADPVSADKAIYDGAIPGMLRTLDPHSNFFDPKQYMLLREDQKGHYYGVGMTIQSLNGKTIVMDPFPGSPAFRSGLRRGDVIVKVNDKSTDHLNTSEIADLLKGPRGTQVTITISREGQAATDFVITRDEIPRQSVQDAMWLRPGIAYIDINQFNETTGSELEDAFKKLGENNIKGLVLDLRDNPGGLLTEGVAVADKFLQKGQTIVSHRGRASAERPYIAKNGNHGRNYPVVVLVNRMSASAAEIVSGALQDHDRAWILGETTFGKGLVQTVYPLAENTGLALTTAHFYTPSGRLIQRDYTNKSFFDYYYHKDDNTKNPLDVKMTDSGRTVYGGGGITPDEKYVAPKLDKLETELLRKSAFFTYTRYYFGLHDLKLPNGWTADAENMADFHDWLLKNNYTFTEADFTKDNDWMARLLKNEITRTALGLDVSRKQAIETDPEVAQAIDALPKAKSLLDTAQRIIVQRISGQLRSAQ